MTLTWEPMTMAACDGAHAPPICGAMCRAVRSPFELARLFLKGLELSTARSENGLVEWVNQCADHLARGDDGNYWCHELGYPRKAPLS